MRLLALVREHAGVGGVYVNHDPEYRDAIRLWQAGFIVLVETKYPWFKGNRMFRELGLFNSRKECSHYPDRCVFPTVRRVKL